MLSISTALDDTSLTNLNLAQLVDNAVNWAAHGSILPPITLGPNPPHEPVGYDPVPEPAALVTWGAGILGIIAVSYVRRTRAEP